MTKAYTLEEIVDICVSQGNEFFVIQTYNKAYFGDSGDSKYINFCLEKYKDFLNQFQNDEEVKRRLNSLNHKKQLTNDEIRELSQIYKYYETNKIPRDEILYSKQDLVSLAKKASLVYTVQTMVEDYKEKIKTEKEINDDEI